MAMAVRVAKAPLTKPTAVVFFIDAIGETYRWTGVGLLAAADETGATWPAPNPEPAGRVAAAAVTREVLIPKLCEGHKALEGTSEENAEATASRTRKRR
jgi:hypothetical protein